MQTETVVLVHGLWMNGMDMILLKQRIAAVGFITEQFTYPSIGMSPTENVVLLSSYIKKITTPTLHFVCHSLGGILIRHLFNHYPDQRPGRIVTLGTPHLSSKAAKQLSRIAPGRLLLGKSVDHGLLGEVPPWQHGNSLGVIAGKLRMGVGMFIPGIPKPNDGTVAVEETRLPAMSDHIILPVSHFGMLLSRRVAHQTIHFLQHARFDH